MASFRMHCPKCNSTDLEGIQDRQNYFGQKAVLVLHCRTCGKVLYGDVVIEQEYHVQKQAWEAAEARRLQEERSKKAVATRAREYEFSQLEKREQEVTSRRRSRDRERVLSMERVVSGSSENLRDDDAPGTRLTVEVSANLSEPRSHCAWRDCTEPARANSKYCSRNCSNKNARHRHRQRRKGDGSSTPA